MKDLLVPFLLIVICLTGCNDDKDASPIPTTSSASSTSSLSSSLATSSSSLVSSSSVRSSLSSSSLSSFSAQSSQALSSIPFTLSSNSFVTGDYIPVKYSCTQVSPHLKWDITSDAVKSFALIVEDIDAIAIVGYPYVHWDVYNIPVSIREIVEGASLHAMPTGSLEGLNNDEVSFYSGPCPLPNTGLHHYYFALYALNSESLTVDIHHPMKRSAFESLYASNILQKVEIIGLFNSPKN